MTSTDRKAMARQLMARHPGLKYTAALAATHRAQELEATMPGTARSALLDLALEEAKRVSVAPQVPPAGVGRFPLAFGWDAATGEVAWFDGSTNILVLGRTGCGGTSTCFALAHVALDAGADVTILEAHWNKHPGVAERGGQIVLLQSADLLDDALDAVGSIREGTQERPRLVVLDEILTFCRPAPGRPGDPRFNALVRRIAQLMHHPFTAVAIRTQQMNRDPQTWPLMRLTGNRLLLGRSNEADRRTAFPDVGLTPRSPLEDEGSDTSPRPGQGVFWDGAGFRHTITAPPHLPGPASPC